MSEESAAVSAGGNAPSSPARTEYSGANGFPNTPVAVKRRQWKRIAIPAIIVIAAAAAYWRLRDVLWIINEVLLPYTGAIAFLSLGLIGLRFKDWKKYEHPYAPRAALCILFLCGILMGVNSYRDRQSRIKQQQDTAAALESIRSQAVQESAKTNGKLDGLTGEVHDFKEKVKPDAIRGEMSDLRTTLDKVINPPKAKLLFTFAPLIGSLVPIRQITLPLNTDGTVHVLFALINNTDVPADATEAIIEICRTCKFAKEPEGFIKVPASADTVRNYVYGDMPAAGAFRNLVVDIIPPPNASAFNVQVWYRCKTCVIDRFGTIGTIHLMK